jgi:hypothetical protein
MGEGLTSGDEGVAGIWALAAPVMKTKNSGARRAEIFIGFGQLIISSAPLSLVLHAMHLIWQKKVRIGTMLGGQQTALVSS